MKTILITGSSRGIGKAVAMLAHKQGYRIIVHGKSHSDELERTHKQLEGSIKTAFDVSDKGATHSAIFELLKEVITIDVLVNNAGIGLNLIKDISEVDDDKAIEEYKVNVLGTLHCIQAVLPKMLEKGGGSVINISSIKGCPDMATMSTLTYAPAKAGVMSLTKALAKAYPNVRFNAVVPGYVKTDQANNWDEEIINKISSSTILGRIAKPEEIAPLVMFLASDGSSYITGSAFLVDGGFSIKGK
jgi:3-oxoacyl-[acyl-carrier protein] reductase